MPKCCTKLLTIETGVAKFVDGYLPFLIFALFPPRFDEFIIFPLSSPFHSFADTSLITITMLVSPLSSQNFLSNVITTFISNSTTTTTHSSDFLFYPSSAHTSKLLPCNCISSPFLKPLPSTDALRRVSHTASNDDRDGNNTDGHHPHPQFVSSASAVASAIRRASSTPVEFSQRIEKDHTSRLVLPSPDFQRLCVEQLHLFRRIVDPGALLSVYVRPAGSYVMDRLELRQVISYPGEGAHTAGIVILIGNFNVPTGLRAAESALSSQQVEEVPECRAIVFPMVKHPFVVGFLVAELPMVEGRDPLHCPSPEETYASPLSGMDMKFGSMPHFKDEQLRTDSLTAEQRSNAINISQSLAMAYVMDQKAMLLQQSTWQNNVRMSNLVEQIRGPLSSIRTLSKMLSLHMKRSEVSFDIVEDIMVQGDRMKDTLQQLQEAVYLTKANIMRYNEETLKKMHSSTYVQQGPVRSELSDWSRERSEASKFSTSTVKDLELPMPPLALAPLREHGTRPCNVSEVLSDLVGAIRPLAHKQERLVELRELSASLQVAVEEPALRQALSNLIEGALLRTRVGGNVEVVSTGAPAGGSLVLIDDDGPDMHYMTQMHSLAPFGPDLLSVDMVEDNMTWNFVAGLTVARETLESYGCVVRVISPRTLDAALGAGGTRIELWLPSFAQLSDNIPSQEV